MKPVKLKFSGLQSYREEQLIDFEELGALGLFGVFGPTGSGKSTILDAITLALFGRVERAKSGTRGILNQFENRLSVSFEFVLGGSQYLAERLYAREKSDPDSVRNRAARLLNITDGGRVLADKANEMDTRVTRLLGMSFDDFSRAVILPQGKFDQFLKLTGSDRARMLENILRLERYGENLWKKVSGMENSLHHEIQTNQKLIDQLGDASEEAITEAEKQLIQQNNLIKQKSEAVNKIEAALKELEQLEQLHREMTDLTNRRESLESRRPVMEQERCRLELAQKAEPLRSILAQADDLIKKAENDDVRLKELAAGYTAIKTGLEEAEARMKKAGETEKEVNRIKESELPRIALSLDYEKQAASLAAEAKQPLGLAEAKRLEQEQMTAQGKEMADLLKQAREKRESLTNRRQGFTAIITLRPAIEKAVNALSEAISLESQRNAAENTLNKREKALYAQESALRKLLAVSIAVGDDQSDDQVDGCLQSLTEISAAMVQKAGEKLKEAEENLDNARKQNMAAALAEKLMNGEPCPVCGSTVHPNPGSISHQDNMQTAAVQNQVSATRKELELLTGWEKEVSLAYNTYQTLQQEIAAIHRPNLDRLEEAAKSAAAALDDTLQELSRQAAIIPEAAGLPVPSRPTVAVFKQALDQADKEGIALEQDITLQQQTINRIEPALSALRERYAGLKTEEKNLRENARALENKAAEYSGKINDITGGISPENYRQRINEKVTLLLKEVTDASQHLELMRKQEQEISRSLEAQKAVSRTTGEHLASLKENLKQNMTRLGFTDEAKVREALLEEAVCREIAERLDEYEISCKHVHQKLAELAEKTGEHPFDAEKLVQTRAEMAKIRSEHEEAVRRQGALEEHISDLRERQIRWNKLKKDLSGLVHKMDLASKLVTLLKGRKFVQFLAEEHLRDMAAEASIRLGALTCQRYALELDENCNFVMRDDYNGGQRRPVNTLSGGETFLTSLSLALALSSKIQLKGRFPLGFFFLDEGFGTLDPDKLEVVVNTLEKLHDNHRMVGIITHVPELRNRMPRYLEVKPSQMDGTGSVVKLMKS